MARQYQIPGGPFINETATRQYQIPGGAFINETVSVTAATFPSKPTIVRQAVNRASTY